MIVISDILCVLYLCDLIYFVICYDYKLFVIIVFCVGFYFCFLDEL